MAISDDRIYESRLSPGLSRRQFLPFLGAGAAIASATPVARAIAKPHDKGKPSPADSST